MKKKTSAKLTKLKKELATNLKEQFIYDSTCRNCGYNMLSSSTLIINCDKHNFPIFDHLKNISLFLKAKKRN